MTEFQTNLKERGATLSENERIMLFGNAEAEFTAFAEDKSLLVPLFGVTPLRLTGADRLDFLHGQVSNEVKRLAVGGSSHALLLNYKGHALAEMRIYRREDDLFIAVDGGAGNLVERELRAHIIFDQVELENLTGKLVTLTVQGKEATTLVQQVLAIEGLTEDSFVQAPFESAKVLIAPTKRTAAGGVDLHVLARDAAKLLDVLCAAGAVPAGESALDIARVTAGIASAEHEGGEGVLPQECGLEGAISYRKGCYLGQEIMARIEARGKVRRKLVGLRLDGKPDVSDIRLGEKTVGRLGTVVQHPEWGVLALAVLRGGIKAEEVLEVGDARAVLTDLPVGCSR